MEPSIQPTERGATVETDRYRVVFRDGYIESVQNKLTREEYLDTSVAGEAFLPNLPSGLGTQAGGEALAAAERLYHWPWWEHPADSRWPNQHYAAADTKCTVTLRQPNGCTLTYAGLSDGSKRYEDETFGLDIDIEAGTGDLLITPWGASPREGVYAANLTMAPLAPAVTAEAPIFDGVRLDRSMQPMLWANAWGGYWDYAFIALNGYKKGAVAIWTEDAELRYYKSLFYLVNQEGLSFSFSTMNLPPFETVKAARSATPWRLQAFDTSWAQAAARFRDWRAKQVKIAPRPDWVKNISYVGLCSSGNATGMDALASYFGNDPVRLARVANFAATVRKAKFDTRHYDNTPYDGFGDDMKRWAPTGMKFMAYLQPMIMWGAPNKDETEYMKTWDKHMDADTRSVFQTEPDLVVTNVDQHHLGHREYQRWFLDCVKAYIQEYGAKGVYHDQSYHCPIDRRGPIEKLGNMTSVQGMADYFYKAATENPDSVHGTEHMTEVNNVGASLGIAGGILWSTAPCMRQQRIKHGTCVSAALSYPNGALFSFPHFSDITRSRSSLFFNWGQDLMERRAEIAGGYLPMDAADAANFRNHKWIDHMRAQIFVREGLRPVFPENFSRSVRSYFTAASGAEFRYTDEPWGSALMQYAANGTPVMQYGRAHGAYEAKTPVNIYGWAMYSAEGPVGLHPERYYPLDPGAKRPAVYFSPANKYSAGLYESYADDCVGTDTFAWALLKPSPRGTIIEVDEMLIHAPKKPARVFVNGFDRTAGLQEKSPTTWWVNFRCNQTIGTTTILAVLDAPAPGLGDAFEKQILCRTTLKDDSLDMVDHAAAASHPKVEKTATGIKVTSAKAVSQMLFSVAPPADAKFPQSLKLTTGAREMYINGAKGSDVVKFEKPEDFAFVALRGESDLFRAMSCTLEWVAATPEPEKN